MPNGRKGTRPADASSTNKTLRISLPSCSSGGFRFTFMGEHDNEAGGFLDVHGRVVDEHGVFRANKRRDFAFAVAFVALMNFLDDLLERQMFTLLLVLFAAPFGASFGS